MGVSFDEAVEKVIRELRKEGFGVVTEINMQEIFKKKLDIDFRPYLILGVCNPGLAYEALLEEDKIGVFLPCNVLIQERETSDVEISIVNPEELMHSVDDLNLRTFATEIKESLQQVILRC